MKLKQIHKQFIDWRMGGDHKLFYSLYNGKVLIGNEFQFYILDEDECLIDLSKCTEVEMYTVIAKEADHPDIILPTGNMIRDKKILIDVYKVADDKDSGVEIGVNGKLLKYFENCKLKSNKDKPLQVISVFEDDKLVGFVMPCRLPKKVEDQ